jgi:RNA polymerase sigma-70 factor, ECF subfamily
VAHACAIALASTAFTPPLATSFRQTTVRTAWRRPWRIDCTEGPQQPSDIEDCPDMSVAAQNRTSLPPREPEADESENREPISLEAVLVDRLRAGNRAAQAELFRRYRDRLRHQALKVIGNPALADEIVQEAWMNGMAAIHRFEGRSTFATWMTAIVLNEARVKRKREARSLPLSGLARQDRRGLRLRRGGVPGEQLESHSGVDDGTPERLLLEKEVRDRFEQALRSLSPAQRTVVVLRDLRGATPAEACRAMRVTDLAHRVHLCRARARIRQMLED